MDDATVPMSPAWWLNRLWGRLTDTDGQRDVARSFDDYYRGEHPLPWLAPQARDEFARILRMSRSNYCGLVVDAVAELSRIEGFRVKNNRDALDPTLLTAMDENEFDFFGDLAILESLIAGTSFLMISPNPDRNAKAPLITVESATQAVSEDEPGRFLRPAAQLKTWSDDWTGEVHANLFVGDKLYKFRAPKPRNGGDGWRPSWVPREVRGEQWPAVNPLGRPPMFPVPNNPREGSGGISELSDVVDTQDRINKTVADRLMTQDFGAFPQMNATGYPDEDEDGNPVGPIDIGRDRMVTVSTSETKFGQWTAAPLDPYSSAKREDVKDIAAATRTPADYLLGELTNVNGQTLIASRAGLVAKVRQRQRGWDLGFERAARAIRRMMDQPDEPVETVWADPEYRTEGERTDAVIKKVSQGIIDIRQAREDLGYTPKQIQALEERDRDRAESDPVLRAARELSGGGAGDGAGDGAGALPGGAGPAGSRDVNGTEPVGGGNR